MKITRTFIFEGDEERLKRQLKLSCPDGQYDLCGMGPAGLSFTVITEGASPKVASTMGAGWNGPHPLPYAGSSSEGNAYERLEKENAQLVEKLGEALIQIEDLTDRLDKLPGGTHGA